MGCPYYWYNYNSYACRKIEKDVDEDTYRRYCRDYDYEDCPHYKGGSSGGGCFLTSACVEAKGLSDDCRELTVLRNFRDGYMKGTENGQAEICEYYHIAPTIVDKIRQQTDAFDIFEQIYEELVVPCVALIDNDKKAEAHEKYRSYVKHLQMQYL